MCCFTKIIKRGFSQEIAITFTYLLYLILFITHLRLFFKSILYIIEKKNKVNKKNVKRKMLHGKC